MVLLKNLLLLLLYLSNEHRLRLQISQKFQESTGLQSNDNESAIAIVIEPGCPQSLEANYSSTSVRSLINSKTNKSTSELATVQTTTPNYVDDSDFSKMQTDDPQVHGENDVTIQRPSDYAHDSTKVDLSSDDYFDSNEDDNSRNVQECTTVDDKKLGTSARSLSISTTESTPELTTFYIEPRYGSNEEDKRNDQESGTIDDEKLGTSARSLIVSTTESTPELTTVQTTTPNHVNDSDSYEMYDGDPKVYDRNDASTECLADYNHNTKKNRSRLDYESYEDFASNEKMEIVDKEKSKPLRIFILNSTFTWSPRNKTESDEDYEEIDKKFPKIVPKCVTEKTFNNTQNNKKTTSMREDSPIHRELNNLSIKALEEQKITNDAFFEISIEYSTVMFNHFDNIVTSPISASILMLMVRYGACSCTKYINLAPNLPAKIRKSRAHIKSFIQELNRSKPNGILMGDKIFIADNVVVSEKFSEIIEKVFESKLQQIDFTNALEAAQSINSWSANQTNDSITNVVDPYQFNNETGLVLISVASFNCSWLKPFNHNDTKLMDFSVNGENKKVWTMNQENTFHYGILKDFNSTYIKLPLKGNLYKEPVNMIIILPDKQTNLPNILSNFPKSELKRLMSNTDEEIYINISLPKFEIRSKINLKDKQQAMGIEIIFSDEADFQRITESKYLKVNDFIQESVIHVDEGNYYGSEESTNHERNQNASENSAFFHVNRPFIVLIANNNIILASAQVMDPN